MKHSKLKVPGAELAITCWRPQGEPKAALQIIHGMAEHIRRYDFLAEMFVEAGWLVLGHDHRGHGRTAESGALGQMGSWENTVNDVRRVNRYLRSEAPGVPVGILAHSMGSFMAQELMIDSPEMAGAWALSGSNGKPAALAAGRAIARIERFRVRGNRSSRLLQKLSFGKFNDGFEGRTEFDWLSRDPAQVDAYVKDPHCGFALSAGSWVNLLDALGAMADPNRQRKIPNDLPVYILGGQEDPVSDKSKGLLRLERAYKSAGLTNLTLRIYPGARHEILNETNRNTVIDELKSWFEAVLLP